IQTSASHEHGQRPGCPRGCCVRVPTQSARPRAWLSAGPCPGTIRDILPKRVRPRCLGCTSPDKTDTEIWLTNAVCYRSECCTAFKVASRHKRQLPTGCPPFIPFALLNYVTHSEKG